MSKHLIDEATINDWADDTNDNNGQPVHNPELIRLARIGLWAEKIGINVISCEWKGREVGCGNCSQCEALQALRAIKK